MSAESNDDDARQAADGEHAGPVDPVPAFTPDPARATRLLYLRVLLKSMIAVAAAAVLFVFFAAFLSDDGEENNLPGMRMAIGDMAAGETRVLTWDGRAVIVRRRTAEEITLLEANVARSALRDPESARSTQPETMRGTLRSARPEWFVAIGLGTDYGCPVSYLPPDSEIFAGKPWPGGFADECRGSRYDLAGRVYARQYADKNLVIPAYRLTDDDVLVLGS